MFINIPATDHSYLLRKRIYGIGINDADYVTNPTVNGKKIACPYYQKWKEMMVRCYSVKFQSKNPSYIGCRVSKEWHFFMKFREWMDSQEWVGKELDKDIISPGNKLYSPRLCCFVDSSINKLLCASNASRGDHPLGVSFNKESGRFRAEIRLLGKPKFLGYFDTSEAASSEYARVKATHILGIARDQTDPLIRLGLMEHAAILLAE